jgi:hypothetical protein
MRHSIKLFDQGGIELGDLVTEGGHPQRGDAIQVTSSINVDQVVAFSALDDDRGMLEIGGHLGEAVPHDRPISFSPVRRHVAATLARTRGEDKPPERKP